MGLAERNRISLFVRRLRNGAGERQEQTGGDREGQGIFHAHEFEIIRLNFREVELSEHRKRREVNGAGPMTLRLGRGRPRPRFLSLARRVFGDEPVPAPGSIASLGARWASTGAHRIFHHQHAQLGEKERSVYAAAWGNAHAVAA